MVQSRAWQRLFISLTWLVTGAGWTGTVSAGAQLTADSIMALPADYRPFALWEDYHPWADDSAKIMSWLTTLEAEFGRRRELHLQQQAWLIQIEYRTIYRNVYSAYGLQIMSEALAEARRRKWPTIEAELLLRKGNMLFLQSSFGPAFEAMERGYQKIKEIGFENSPSIVSVLEAMALGFYQFGSYLEAASLLKEALAIRQPYRTPGAERKLLNTLGMCYVRREVYDSAILYFDLAHAQSMISRDTFWASLAHGNKAHVLFLQEKYAEALPLLENDFRQSIRVGERSSAVNAAMEMATIYLKWGQLDQAREYLDYGHGNINFGNLREAAGYFRNLSDINRLQGRYDEAFRYLDSFLLYRDRWGRENDSKIINQAKLNVEVDAYNHQLTMLEQQRSRQVLLRNGLILVLVLFGVIAGLLVRQQLQQRQRERQLAAIREQAARDELMAAREQLRLFTHALREKTELVDAFRGELEELQLEGAGTGAARHEQLHQLLASTILTEDDWKEFRILFDKVYPGFFDRLRQKFSDLTPAETRLLALTRLHLAPKEMASMLGISYDAIKKTRQRLLKKIDLPEEGGWDELVDEI